MAMSASVVRAKVFDSTPLSVAVVGERQRRIEEKGDGRVGTSLNEEVQ
jgi:hypothetical protein